MSAQKLRQGVFWQVKYISLLLSHGGAHLFKSAPRLFTSLGQSPEVNMKSDYYGQMTQLFRQVICQSLENPDVTSGLHVNSR